jgi:histone H3/H4
MEKLYRSAGSRQSHRRRQTPVNTGILIDLYLYHRSLVVIDNYLSSHPLTEEKIDRRLDLEIEILNNQRLAKQIFQNLRLPVWKNLREDLKQVFRLAACGSQENAAAITCNLGKETATNADQASRGAADYIGRKIRNLPYSPPEIAAVLEDESTRKGCNPGLHFHAAIQIHPSHLPLVEKALRKVFAFDYKEVASNKAILIKPITQPGRWASYCCKRLQKTDKTDGRAIFATKSASRAGLDLYDRVMTWLRQLPAPDRLQSDLDALIRPHIKSRPNQELARRIQEHCERLEAMRRKRREQARLYKRLASQSPDQFKLELIEKLRTASTALSASNKTLAGCVISTIPEIRTDDTRRRSEALTERYKGLPGVGEWASTEESYTSRCRAED